MPDSRPETYGLTRVFIQRGLAFIYLTAFLIAANQFIPLAGERGIVPIKLFLQNSSFHHDPSLFFWNSSNIFILSLAWSGIFLSLLALSGLSERFGPYVSFLIWFLLWIFYTSFVNAGQVFYGFGWEMLLLETGFLAMFLGSRETEAPALIIWLLRWLLFRLMFGAGLIKIRGDECWRNLTCMDYHYETQPLPNPLSWYLHKEPVLWHKFEVLSTHAIELILPFAYFMPGILCCAAGTITIFFHIMLILSGNLSWLNYITIVIAMACFSDRFLTRLISVRIPAQKPPGWPRRILLFGLAALILVLSIPPAVNLLSPRQMMNASFDPLHLVNTYGAFGAIEKKRREVILEGTDDPKPGPQTIWREYEFKCKPGDVSRAPCVVSPYHYKLDWQMWFAAMSDFRYHPWILNLAAKLLRNDPETISLIAGNPFPSGPPQFIRARLYEYRFTNWEERKKSGAWWSRTMIADYLPPLSLKNKNFAAFLREMGFASASEEWRK